MHAIVVNLGYTEHSLSVNLTSINFTHCKANLTLCIQSIYLYGFEFYCFKSVHKWEFHIYIFIRIANCNIPIFEKKIQSFSVI